MTGVVPRLGYRLDRLTGGGLREIGERLDRLEDRADAVTELMHEVLREVGGDRPARPSRPRLRVVKGRSELAT